MFPNKKKSEHQRSFWNTKKGLILQVLIILLPSAILLKQGYYLLLGLTISVLLAFTSIKLQKLSLKDIGLEKPKNKSTTIWVAMLSSILLIPLTFGIKKWIIKLIEIEPNLEKFSGIEVNITNLLIALTVAWVFGAFLEELFFRGYLLNTIYKLLPSSKSKHINWGVSLVITSFLTGIGHTYQGITGIILSSIIAIGFGIVYLISKRNLWSSILTHGFYDTIAMAMLFCGII